MASGASRGGGPRTSNGGGESTLKIAVVGPSRSGKTLLARAVAEQPLLQGESAYQPTVAVRIQEISRVLGVDRVKVQLWDCSGSQQYQSYWPALAKDLDGVVLTIDPAHPEQERELETFYRNFAEPNNLYTRQCMVVAIQVQREGSGLGGWSGLQGGLKKLNSVYVSINPTNPAPGVQEAYSHLDNLFMGCLQSKKEAAESAYMAQE